MSPLLAGQLVSARFQWTAAASRQGGPHIPAKHTELQHIRQLTCWNTSCSVTYLYQHVWKQILLQVTQYCSKLRQIACCITTQSCNTQITIYACIQHGHISAYNVVSQGMARQTPACHSVVNSSNSTCACISYSSHNDTDVRCWSGFAAGSTIPELGNHTHV